MDVTQRKGKATEREIEGVKTIFHLIPEYLKG